MPNLRKTNSLLSLALLTLCLESSPTLLAAEALHYLAAGQPDSSVLLAPPPTENSAEDCADMASVVATVRSATSNETAVAFSEKKFGITNFSAVVGAILKPGNLPKTEAFIANVKADSAAATDVAKDYWKRPRPFTVNTNLASGTLEKSFGYPSGHSTEAMVLALVLAELFPDKNNAILAVGRDIGWHRVMIARHYPTDIHAGRVFAKAIVRELKLSPQFQKDFAEAKEEIAKALEEERFLKYSSTQSQ